MEFFIFSSSTAGGVADMARQTEREGFDGLCFGDTQCISVNPYVSMAIAGLAAPKLKVMVGVTNPVTRDASVNAGALATVQLETGGRAVMGIGRGDSAVHKVGRKAATVAEFEEYLVQLQGYLSGEYVERNGKKSRIEWMQGRNLPKVPLDVAATGAGVLAAGARQAERLSLNYGADTDRIVRAVKESREIRRAAGKSPDSLTFGTYMPIAPHPDVKVARNLVKGVAAVYARFQAMPGHQSDQTRAEDRKVIEAVGKNYDNTAHGRSDARHTAYLEDDFLDRFTVVGTPDRCVEQLLGLSKAGLDRIMLVGPNKLIEGHDESRRLLAEVVIPEVRRKLGK